MPETQRTVRHSGVLWRDSRQQVFSGIVRVLLLRLQLSNRFDRRQLRPRTGMRLQGRRHRGESLPGIVLYRPCTA